MAKNLDPRIDAYIEQAADFAQPILRHLRKLVHEGCPDVVETMKWSSPFFEHAGRAMCNMAAFKAHCAFGFWHQGMKEFLGADGEKADTAMGSFGRLTSVKDLPSDKIMIGYVKRATELNESGAPARPRPPARKVEVKVPADLAAALKKDKKAATSFEKFSPSHRKEYIEWITEAKRDETRQKRLASTLEWLAEGKSRNWKYADC